MLLRWVFLAAFLYCPPLFPTFAPCPAGTAVPACAARQGERRVAAPPEVPSSPALEQETGRRFGSVHHVMSLQKAFKNFHQVSFHFFTDYSILSIHRGKTNKQKSCTDSNPLILANCCNATSSPWLESTFMKAHRAFLSVLSHEYHCPWFSAPTPGFLRDTTRSVGGVTFSCTKLQCCGPAGLGNFQISGSFSWSVI